MDGKEDALLGDRSWLTAEGAQAAECTSLWYAAMVCAFVHRELMNCFWSEHAAI